MLLTAMLSCLISCNGDRDAKLVTVPTTGLEGDNLGFPTLVVKDRQTAVIAGSWDHVTHNPDESSNQFATVTRTAMVARTVDEGRTWKQKQLGEGSILKIVQAGGKLFLTKVLDEPKRYAVYSSADFGETWREEKEFPAMFTSLFPTETGYWAIVKDSGVIRTHLEISADSGRSWVVQDLPYLALNAVKRGNKLVFLSCDNPAALPRMNRVVEYDPGDKSSKVTTLPAPFDCYFISDPDGNITLTGRQEDHLAVYGVDRELRVSLKYSYTAEAGYFPQGYFAGGGWEWILAGKRGPEEVSNVVLGTADNGKSWNKVTFDYPKSVKPYGCFSDDRGGGCWFFSGPGRMQKLEFEIVR